MKNYKLSLYKTREERKSHSIEILKKANVNYIENLPSTFEAKDVIIKSIEEIAKRYIACIISIQVAFDIIEESNLEDSFAFFSSLIKKYEVEKFLNKTEKLVFQNKLDKQELINLTWKYESINVLGWVLGLNKELSFPNILCDSEFLLKEIAVCDNFNDFLNKCKLINIEDILDELDLEYRYHWAAVENRINKERNNFIINEEIVMERRRALEWLFEEIEDWNDISLDT